MNDREMFADLYRFFCLVRDAKTDRQYETARQTMEQLSQKYQRDCMNDMLVAIWAERR